MTFPFLFFGAGDASYYEQAVVTVVFAAAPTRAQKQKIERAIPKPLERSKWTKRTLLVVTDDYALSEWDDFDDFNAAIETWLHACHAIAPIDFVLRGEDSEAGTAFSAWHHASLAGAAALIAELDDRYDDDDDRDQVRETLLEMMEGAGIASRPTADWQAALDAGDAAALAPLIENHADDIRRVLDPGNPEHRRALLGGKPALATHGPLDVVMFEAALIEDTAEGRRVIDTMVARATAEPFWATTVAASAAEVVEVAPDAAFAVLDRVVDLATAHGVVVENALWAAQAIGWKKVARARLERYWSIAIAKLPEWAELRPYLNELAPVLGREPPPPAAPVTRGRSRKRRG